MKRLSVFVFCFALVFPCVLGVFAAQPEPYGYAGTFGYNKIASGTEAEIVSYCGLGGPETIPDFIEGLPVTSVAVRGIYCENDSQITSLTLPSTLVNFSADCLQNCYALESIALSGENEYFRVENGILFTSDGTKVVLYPPADRRETIVLPNGVTAIGVQAFCDASYLRRVTFPKTLRVIESGDPAGQNRGAFENCTDLRKVKFPMSIEEIGNYAFFSCTMLSEVVIRDESQVSIGMDAFFNCPRLDSVVLREGVYEIGAEAFGYLQGSEGSDAITYLKEDFTIYGINRTVASTYAKNFSVRFATLDITTDFFNDVSITGTIPNMSEFHADRTDSGAALDNLKRYLADSDTVALYDYSITPKKNTVVTEPFAVNAYYSAPIPDGLSDENLFVFRVTPDARPEFLESDILLGSDLFGSPALRLYFETDGTGEFAFVNGTPMPGQVRGEGEVEIGDLTALAKYIAGWDFCPRILNCDMTGDGQVSLADLLQLAKYLAGWNVELFPFASQVTA